MANLRNSIDMKCKDCNYDPLDKGSWRVQVESCNDRACPLWEVRPMTTATRNAQRIAKQIINAKNI